jgi:PAS domain S-box-containing protein
LSPDIATQSGATRPSNEDLHIRLEEAEATINAIYCGQVDAVVVKGPRGPQVYTLEGADHPYRVLVEQMHEGTVTLDSDRVVLYSNRQFANMLGSAVESITGASFERFLPSNELPRFSELLEAAARNGHSAGEFDLTAAHGHCIPIHASLTRLDVSGMQIVSLVASDLRDQRRSEAIVKEERLSRLILDQAGEAIVLIEPRGLILRCSQSARSLAGSPILGSHFDRVFPLITGGAPFGAEQIFDFAHAGRQIRGLEAALNHGGRDRGSVLVSASPLWSDAGDLLGCVVTLIDITHRKRAEEALARQAEQLMHANSDLKQFAHSASHDLREPLRQLAVFNELLQKRYQDQLGEEAAGLIQHSVDAAHRMEGLLRGLLEYTQAADATQHSAGPTDTNAVVAKTIATFDIPIRECGAHLECHPLPPLQVHEVHLTQLFQNLIGYALKYRSEAALLVRISAEPIGEMWRISVADNGIGIAPEYHDHVFGLFQRLHGGGKYSGSGIGLAICQKIVQRYGGRIWVDSEPGHGATFSFVLPGGSDDVQGN